MDLSLERLDDFFEKERKDPFFDPVTTSLIKAVANLAKSSKYPDLLTCKVILELENLAERLEAASLEEALKLPFAHFIGMKGRLIGTAIQGSAEVQVQMRIPAEASIIELDKRRSEVERLLRSPKDSTAALVS
ncbi:MAG: hypothetical protein MH252_00255 [Thermosynechococcaceae cyanobacterium MS004]|nr:hypothetical protein [Thermosynechococcaceae cyanobacterium MS004]